MRQIYFCIGSAKSGTTILARLLDQQTDVACLWEGYLLRPSHSSSVLNPDGKAWKRHGLPEERVVDWHRRATTRVRIKDREMMAMRHQTQLSEIVREVLDVFGRSSGAEVVGDKWPDYHNHLRIMLKAFPDAKYVYNVRDPRGVWNSGQTFRDREAGDRVLGRMLRADANVRPHLADKRFISLRYEDLIADPSSTMRRLGDFLGFEFNPSELTYDVAADPFPNRWYWVPPATGNLDVGLTEKWRDEMPAEKQRAVSHQCAEFIEYYDYPAM